MNVTHDQPSYFTIRRQNDRVSRHVGNWSSTETATDPPNAILVDVRGHVLQIVVNKALLFFQNDVLCIFDFCTCQGANDGIPLSL